MADTLRVLSVQNILGDSLPEGRYAVEALVSTGDDTVTVQTGTLWLQPDTLPMLGDPSLLRFRTTTTVEGVAPRRLVTRTVMMNPTHRYMALGYGACSLLLRAYRTPERTGVPIWRSEYRAPAWQSKHRGARGRVLGYVCPLYLAGIIVAPGQVFSPGEFNTGIPVHEILDDSLPDGRYYFVAKLVWFAYGNGSESDTVRVEAGSADLSSAVEPLPQQRNVGSLRYQAFAAQDSAHPDTLDVGFTTTNRGDDSVFLVGARNTTCPSGLFGYLDPADSDRWYLHVQPDWGYPGCPLADIPPTWLGPGETRTFTARVSARADSVGTGSYSLMLVLRMEQEPAGGGTIVLSAGDVTLSGY